MTSGCSHWILDIPCWILDIPYLSRAVLPKPPFKPVSAKLAYLASCWILDIPCWLLDIE